MKSVFVVDLPDLKTAIRVSRKDLLKHGEPDYYIVTNSLARMSYNVRAIICECEQDFSYVENTMREVARGMNIENMFYSRKDKERVRVYG